MNLIGYVALVGMGLYKLAQFFLPDLRPADDRSNKVLKKTPEFDLFLGPLTIPIGGKPQRVVLGPHTSSRTYLLMAIGLLIMGISGVLHYNGLIERLTDWVFVGVFCGGGALIFVAAIIDYYDRSLYDDKVGEVVDIPDDDYDGPEVI